MAKYEALKADNKEHRTAIHVARARNVAGNAAATVLSRIDAVVGDVPNLYLKHSSLIITLDKGRQE